MKRMMVSLCVCLASATAMAADYSVSASGANWSGVSGASVEFRIRPMKKIVWGISADQMRFPAKAKSETFDMKTTDVSLIVGKWINQQSSTKTFGGHFFIGGGMTSLEASPARYRLASNTTYNIKLGFGFDWYLWRLESQTLALTLGVVGSANGGRVIALDDPLAKEEKINGAASALAFGLAYWF